MSLTKYTNVDEINARTSGTGQFLKKEDLFVISQDASELSDFGLCSSDIMEITLYDLNGNILPQIENGVSKNVRYIKNIMDYYLKTNTNEFAIDIEKILKESNYKNGIIRVNVGFVRLKVGDESKYRRMWIQEISATRSEIRVLPLNIQNDINTTIQNNEEFVHLQNLDVDELTYRNYLETINQITTSFYLEKCKEYIISKFSNIDNAYDEFVNIMFNDFNLKIKEEPKNSFETFVSDIFYSYKQKINQKISELTNKCNLVSRNTVSSELLEYLINSFNEKSDKLIIRDLIIDNVQSNSQEQIEENVFETVKNINTKAVSENADDYSTVDLSKIMLNTSTLDDFEKLQQTLALIINDTSDTSSGNTSDTSSGNTSDTSSGNTSEDLSKYTKVNLYYSPNSGYNACYASISNTYLIDKMSLEEGPTTLKNITGGNAPTGYYSDKTFYVFYNPVTGKIEYPKECGR